jgi:undecaprenyl diphosphate synthase
LNFAIAYGSKQEITDAVKAIARKVANGKLEWKAINEEIVEKHLYTKDVPPPDLIIRTGGEKRLSNFLLWQSAYAELFFVDKMWPEFTKEDFINILKEFSRRERRFGR